MPHFTLFFLPLIMFVLAAGALHFIVGANAYARAAALALLGLWLGAQLAGLSLYYRYPPHGADGLRTLAATLTSRSAREPLFVTPPILSATLAQYYAGAIYGLPSDFDVGRVYLRYDPAAWNAGCLQRLSSVTGGRQSFWLVYRPELDRDGSFLGSLNRAYTPVEHRSYPYADLYYFAPKP